MKEHPPAILRTTTIRCHNKKAKAKGTFEALISEEWRDDCPKPWLSETVPGTCAHMMACRAFKYMSFFNISHWAPNVEVCAIGILWAGLGRALNGRPRSNCARTILSRSPGLCGKLENECVWTDAYPAAVHFGLPLTVLNQIASVNR